jgi:hypothetical protein
MWAPRKSAFWFAFQALVAAPLLVGVVAAASLSPVPPGSTILAAPPTLPKSLGRFFGGRPRLRLVGVKEEPAEVVVLLLSAAEFAVEVVVEEEDPEPSDTSTAGVDARDFSVLHASGRAVATRVTAVCNGAVAMFLLEFEDEEVEVPAALPPLLVASINPPSDEDDGLLPGGRPGPRLLPGGGIDDERRIEDVAGVATSGEGQAGNFLLPEDDDTGVSEDWSP